MLQIPLQSIPNQEFYTTLDNNSYFLQIRYTNGCMSMSVMRNNVQITQNIRVVPNFTVIPYQYLEDGNFIFTTANQQLVNYTRFNIDQQLYYLSASEMATFRAAPPAIIPASYFNPLGGLPLRFAPQGYHT